MVSLSPPQGFPLCLLVSPEFREALRKLFLFLAFHECFTTHAVACIIPQIHATYTYTQMHTPHIDTQMNHTNTPYSQPIQHTPVRHTTYCAQQIHYTQHTITNRCTLAHTQKIAHRHSTYPALHTQNREYSSNTAHTDILVYTTHISHTMCMHRHRSQHPHTHVTHTTVHGPKNMAHIL